MSDTRIVIIQEGHGVHFPATGRSISKSRTPLKTVNKNHVFDTTAARRRRSEPVKRCLPVEIPKKLTGTPILSAAVRRTSTDFDGVSDSAKRRRVSFGPVLSPEYYDKQLPVSTPVRKGATPRRLSLLDVDSATLKSTTPASNELLETCMKVQTLKKSGPTNVQQECFVTKSAVALRSIYGKGATPKLSRSTKKSSLGSIRMFGGSLHKNRRRSSYSDFRQCKKLWSDVVRNGRRKSGIQFQAPKKNILVSRKGTKPTRSIPAKATPQTVNRHGAATTGHIDSPATLVIGRKPSVPTPRRVDGKRKLSSAARQPAKKLWSDIVRDGRRRKSGVGLQTVRSIVSCQRRPKKSCRVKSPAEAPLTHTHGYASTTGHVDSPATLVIGRKTSIRRTPRKIDGKRKPPSSGRQPAKKLWSDIVRNGRRKSGVGQQHLQVNVICRRMIKKSSGVKNGAEASVSNTHGYANTTGHVGSPATLIIGKKSNGQNRVFRKSCMVNMEQACVSVDDVNRDRINDVSNTLLNKSKVSQVLISRVQPKTPCFKGVRELVKTPKEELSPKLRGIRELVQTPKCVGSPSLCGVKELVRTPAIVRTPSFKGIRELVKTPKQPASPSLKGVRELVKTPKLVRSPTLKGVRELVKTPIVIRSPSLIGVRELVKTPREIQSPRLTGLREMIKTPKEAGSPSLFGVRETLKTPKAVDTPRLSGIRELVKTPKIINSPSLEGVRELVTTPKHSKSPCMITLKRQSPKAHLLMSSKRRRKNQLAIRTVEPNGKKTRSCSVQAVAVSTKSGISNENTVQKKTRSPLKRSTRSKPDKLVNSSTHDDTAMSVSQSHRTMIDAQGTTCGAKVCVPRRVKVSSRCERTTENIVVSPCQKRTTRSKVIKTTDAGVSNAATKTNHSKVKTQPIRSVTPAKRTTRSRAVKSDTEQSKQHSTPTTRTPKSDSTGKNMCTLESQSSANGKNIRCGQTDSKAKVVTPVKRLTRNKCAIPSIQSKDNTTKRVKIVQTLTVTTPKATRSRTRKSVTPAKVKTLKAARDVSLRVTRSRR